MEMKVGNVRKTESNVVSLKAGLPSNPASDLGRTQYVLYAFRVARSRRLDFPTRKNGKRGREGQQGGEEAGRRDAALRRGSPRKKSSARDAIILAAPCSRFFWIASRSSGALRPRPVPPRACINHETPGILSRRCETSVILDAPAPPFFPSPRHSECAPERNAALLATLFFFARA